MSGCIYQTMNNDCRPDALGIKHDRRQKKAQNDAKYGLRKHVSKGSAGQKVDKVKRAKE